MSSVSKRSSANAAAVASAVLAVWILAAVATVAQAAALDRASSSSRMSERGGLRDLEATTLDQEEEEQMEALRRMLADFDRRFRAVTAITPKGKASVDGDDDWERLVATRALLGRIAAASSSYSPKRKRGGGAQSAAADGEEEYWRERDGLESFMESILDFLDRSRREETHRRQQLQQLQQLQQQRAAKKSTPISFTRL